MGNSIARQWQAFRHDEPGSRFTNHHDRMKKQGSRAGAIVRVGLGAILALAGIVMLFVPGPGLLVGFFGIGLLAGESRMLAGAMDRAEPRLRRGGRRVQTWWHARAMIVQDAMIALAVCLLGAACYAAYRVWLA